MAEDDLLVRARGLWRELAGVPVDFTPSGGVNVVVAPGSRMCPPGWTGIVGLGGAVVATAPDARRAELMSSAARRLSAAQLLDLAGLSAAVPVLDALGPASLLCLDRDGFTAGHQAVGVRQLPVGDRRVAVLSAEAEESGLDVAVGLQLSDHAARRPDPSYRVTPVSP